MITKLAKYVVTALCAGRRGRHPAGRGRPGGNRGRACRAGRAGGAHLQAAAQHTRFRRRHRRRRRGVRADDGRRRYPGNRRSAAVRGSERGIRHQEHPGAALRPGARSVVRGNGPLAELHARRVSDAARRLRGGLGAVGSGDRPVRPLDGPRRPRLHDPDSVQRHSPLLPQGPVRPGRARPRLAADQLGRDPRRRGADQGPPSPRSRRCCSSAARKPAGR